MKIINDLFVSNITLNRIKEYTIECNPVNINNNFINYAKNIKNLRISLGIQSFNQKTLNICGRFDQNKKKVDGAFEKLNIYQINTSIDLINGLPGLNVNIEINNLKKYLKKFNNINHISFYELSIENNSKFFKLKDIKYPSENKISLYEMKVQHLINDFLFKRYEISNYAKNNYWSLHNLNYWKYKNYIGLGPSAHSTINEKRIENIPDIYKYLSKNYKKSYILTKKEQIEEFILMGFRLLEGINITQFNKRFNTSFKDLFKKNIEYYQSNNMLLINSNNIKITNKGLNILNIILINFFKEMDSNLK